MESKDKYTETVLFPIDMRKLIEGEKNKVIKVFLNQLDMKNIDEETKKELRQVFLDSINGFARASKYLIKQFSEQANTFEKLVHIIENRDKC